MVDIFRMTLECHLKPIQVYSEASRISDRTTSEIKNWAIIQLTVPSTVSVSMEKIVTKNVCKMVILFKKLCCIIYQVSNSCVINY